MPDARSEIESVNKRFMELYEAGDLTGFREALYTQDALVMLPGLKALEGRAGAMSFLESAKGRSIARVKLNTLELEIFGDTACERGSAEAQYANGSVANRNKYIVVWKRTSEGWQLHRDIINSDLNAPLPQSS
jgi:ketosteroid isomerase-like protein